MKLFRQTFSILAPLLVLGMILLPSLSAAAQPQVTFNQVDTLQGGDTDAPQATTLADGTVLVTFTDGDGSSVPLHRDAQIYNPSTGQFTDLGPQQCDGYFGLGAQVLLSNDKVLIAGQVIGNGSGGACAELFDPVNRTFTPISDPPFLLNCSAVATLKDGRVLLLGDGLIPNAPLAMIFNPSTNNFNVIASPQFNGGASSRCQGRTRAETLPDGTVAIVDPYSGRAERFDPTLGTFTAYPGTMPSRSFAAVTPLADHKMLIAGGGTDPSDPQSLQPQNLSNTSFLFDPQSGIFTRVGNINRSLYGGGLTTLDNGFALLVGGMTPNNGIGTIDNPGASTSVYDPNTQTWSAGGKMSVWRDFPAVTLLQGGSVFVFGDARTGPQTAVDIGTPAHYPLTVAPTGTGSGNVSSLTGEVACLSGGSGSCTDTYVFGTRVDLTASADSGSEFLGWTGACSGTDPQCRVTLLEAASVGADFEPAIGPPAPSDHQLLVALTGAGSGSVNGGSVACPIVCGARVADGTAVVLTATPAAGSTFAGWSGACSGSLPTCALTMNADQSVTARFVTQTQPVTPTNPSDPGQPGDPGQPSSPNKPSNPANPGQPGGGSTSSGSGTNPSTPVCSLRQARSRVFVYAPHSAHSGQIRLVMKYKSYSAAKVKVRFVLKDAKGQTILGTATGRFKKQGVLRTLRSVSTKKALRLWQDALAAHKGHQPKILVSLTIPGEANYCARAYTRVVSKPRKVQNQTVWFQQNSTKIKLPKSKTPKSGKAKQH